MKLQFHSYEKKIKEKIDPISTAVCSTYMKIISDECRKNFFLEFSFSQFDDDGNNYDKLSKVNLTK